MKKILSFLNIGPVLNYFGRVFKKDKDGQYPTNQNIRIMHGINRVSIIMFLIALIVMGVRYYTRY